MKAIQINETGDSNVLNYVTIERPTPKKGEVLIRVSAIGVTFGDIMVQRGVYPVMPELPATLGSECSGVVESVGDEVSHLKSGQSVIVLGTQGCYADYVIADAALVIPVSNTLDKDLLAAFPIAFLTAYHLLHTMGQIKAGDTVLLYGAAGGVGSAVIQLAKLANVRIIGLTSSDEKVEFARTQGADHCLNHQTDDIDQRISNITQGKGVDLILNSIAGDTFKSDFNNLNPFGQIIWFGFAAGYPQENIGELLGNNFMKSVGIRTFTLYNIFQKPEVFSSSMKTLLDYFESGQIKPNIDQKLPLSEASRAHQLMESSSVQGRIILQP